MLMRSLPFWFFSMKFVLLSSQVACMFSPGDILYSLSVGCAVSQVVGGSPDSVCMICVVHKAICHIAVCACGYAVMVNSSCNYQ